MIHTLIKKIVLYDDKIEIYYNYTDPIQPGGSSPKDSHRLFFIIGGSNLLHPAAPNKKSTLYGCFFVCVVSAARTVSPQESSLFLYCIAGGVRARRALRQRRKPRPAAPNRNSLNRSAYLTVNELQITVLFQQEPRS